MRKFLSLMMVMFAAVTLAFADDPVQIASGTFNGKNASYTEGWTTTGTGKSRTDCIIIGAGENITSPSIDLSAYDSISITFKGRRYGSLSGSKATVSVAYGANELGTIDITSSSVGNVAGNIGYKVPANLATSAFVFTCTNATSAGSTHGAGIGTITITGIEKTTTPDPDPQPTTQDLYLKLSSDWAGWPAKYAVYYFNDTENGWSEFMTEVEGEDNTYTATIPVGYSKVIFVRLNGAATEANWDNKWSQTVNLTIPENKNHFTVTSGGTGSECDGVWAKYPVVPTYYVAGTMTSWADNMVEMNEGSYTFEGLAAGTYEIKVVDDANNWYGFEVLDQTKSSANIYNAGGNIKFTLAEAGNVTVAYANSKITVTGTFVAPSTKFTVTVPEGTEKTYIAGNFNNWTPAEMTLKAGEEDVFELTVEGVESDTVAYKYLAGADWKFVEVIENNRSYNAADEVSAWKAVPTIYKYAKVKEAPVNWTGHYIIAWADHKPHSAIKVGSSSKDDFVAADDALVFTDGDTISIMEGMDFAVNIRFGASEGAYTLQLPDGKYIYLPNANGVCSKDEATDMYLAVSPSTTQTGIQIGDKADMSNRVIYNNSTNYRSYTNKYEATGYILPTLYRLVDEAFDCQDGPYAILVNGKDVENTVAGEEFDGYKQYVAYLSLTKGDSIQLINTSCGATWLPAIEEGGMSAHFKKGVNAATIDTTGCFDLYIKMKSGDDKIYIGAGICPEDTIRFTVVGDGEALGDWDLAEGLQSKENTLEVNLKAGDYKLKVVDQNNFWFGFEQLSEVAEGLKSLDDDKNIGFTLKEDGKVTFTLIKTETDTTFTVAGNFYYYQPTLVDLKLVPGVWAEADAKIAAWAWTRKEGAEMVDQWTPFFAPIAEGNDTLSVKIDAAADSILFVRFNNEATVPTWDGGEGYIWGQMSNDSIVKESMTYTITDWVAGTWDVYVPAKFYVTGDSALVTDAGFAGKAWNADAIKSENDTLVLNLKADQDYILKVAVNGTWEGENNVKGYNELSEKTEGLLDISNDHNIGFRLNAAGEVKVVYIAAEGENPEIFKLIGDFYVTPAPDPTVSVKGSMNDWAEEIPFVLSDDKTYASLTVENIGADNYDFKFIINGEWRSNGYTYHRDFPGAAGITENNDANMVFQADVDGEYTFYWYFANDSAAIVYPEKPEPVMDDGYYIIGLNGWNVAELTEGDQFWSTGIETGEFSLDVTLAAGDQFKVVRVEDDEIKTWFPEGSENDYVVDANHAGATTVYFRPNYDGNEDWFARCIYVLPTSTVDIDILDTNAPAVKILRDGQILIIKGNKTFNIQGQLVK
jgi:hypothetical protein